MTENMREKEEEEEEEGKIDNPKNASSNSENPSSQLPNSPEYPYSTIMPRDPRMHPRYTEFI